MARAPRLALLLILAGLVSGEARAQVEFGHDVFIGGHDFSHQRYKSVTISTTTRRPPWLGCRLLPAGTTFRHHHLKQGLRVCYLKRIEHRG